MTKAETIKGYMASRRRYILGDNSSRETAVTLRNILLDKLHVPVLEVILIDKAVDDSISLADIRRGVYYG